MICSNLSSPRNSLSHTATTLTRIHALSLCTLRFLHTAGIKLGQKRCGDCGGDIDGIFHHLYRTCDSRSYFPTVRCCRRHHGHRYHRLPSGRDQTGESCWSESDRAARRRTHPASCCIAGLQHFGPALMGDFRQSARASPPSASYDHHQSPDAYHDECDHAAAPPLYQQVVQADRNRAERSGSPQSAIRNTINQGVCDSRPCDGFHAWGDGQPLSALCDYHDYYNKRSAVRFFCIPE